MKPKNKDLGSKASWRGKKRKERHRPAHERKLQNSDNSNKGKELKRTKESQNHKNIGKEDREEKRSRLGRNEGNWL
jgi:hypothetical protein